MKKKNLTINIEIKKRELHSRMLLSLFAASEGFRVYIGNRPSVLWAIEKDVIKKTIFLDKSISKAKYETLKLLKQKNHKIFSIDEEGGQVLNNYLPFLNVRSSKNHMKLISGVFCWGNFDYFAWKKKYKNFSHKFYKTGSPRVDLWRNEISSCYENDIKDLNKKYGKYILITGNFAQGNSLINIKKHIKRNKIKSYIKTQKEIKNDLNFYKEDKKMFLEFIKLIRFLGQKLKQTKIVVRPHPVENLKSYKKLLKYNQNIVIDNSGYILPWIKASSVVIQNGCQTALETYGLNKPLLTYAPFKRGIFTSKKKTTPSKLSKNIKSKEQVLKYLLSKNSKQIKKRNNKIFDHRFHVSQKLSSENIIKVLKKVMIEKNSGNMNPIKILMKNIKSKIRNIINIFYESKLYLAKNEIIKLSDLIELKIKFSKYNKKFEKIKIKKIYEGLYQIN